VLNDVGGGGDGQRPGSADRGPPPPPASPFERLTAVYTVRAGCGRRGLYARAAHDAPPRRRQYDHESVRARVSVVADPEPRMGKLSLLPMDLLLQVADKLPPAELQSLDVTAPAGGGVERG